MLGGIVAHGGSCGGYDGEHCMELPKERSFVTFKKQTPGRHTPLSTF